MNFDTILYLIIINNGGNIVRTNMKMERCLLKTFVFMQLTIVFSSVYIRNIDVRCGL